MKRVSEMEWDIKYKIYLNAWDLSAHTHRLYQLVTADLSAWNGDLLSKIQDNVESMRGWCDFGEEVEKIHKSLSVLFDTRGGIEDDILILENAVQFFDLIKQCMEQQIYTCNVCGKPVFFRKFPEQITLLRKTYGFRYWDAVWGLEHKDNSQCPICKANDRERLMIAFLQNIRPEGDAKIKMLHIAPSDVLEQWAKEQDYIDYESADLEMEGVSFLADIQDMHTVPDEAYDIVICSHVLEHVEDDRKAMSELCRITKAKGLCIVLVPLMVGLEQTDEEWGCSQEENWRRFGQYDHCRLYAADDFVSRLEEAGFYVTKIGEDWFGKEFYEECGFDANSILYVATKEHIL